MKRKLYSLFLACFFLVFVGCSSVIQTPATPRRQNPKAGVFRGAYHVHTEFSHDSKASLGFVIASAQKADLDFVVVTDHNNRNGAAAYQKMARPERPLLIFGNEISTWFDGHLVALGIEKDPPDIGETQKNVDVIHEQNGYTVFAHPLSKRKPWTNWNIQNFDGLEVFCFSDYFYAEGATLILKALFLPPKLFLKSTLKTPEEGLKLWDEHLRTGRKVSGFGATDAHLKLSLGNLALENYSLYLQSVTMYAFADELNGKKIITSLGEGKSFMAFEVFGLAQDFTFSASRNGETFQIGSSLKSGAPTQFEIKSPEEADIRLIHNGKVIAQTQGTLLEHQDTSEGYYRAEVYRDGELWIVSNPIYVE